MVLGLEIGSSNITFVTFGNNILEIIKDPLRKGEIFVLQQGVIPTHGNIKKALDTLMDNLQTCNITPQKAPAEKGYPSDGYQIQETAASEAQHSQRRVRLHIFQAFPPHNQGCYMIHYNYLQVCLHT